MTAKRYLSQLRALDDRINQKIREASELKALAFNAGALGVDGDRVQTSGSAESRQCRAIEKYVDMQAEIDADIDAYVDLKHRIINEIQRLSDKRHAAVLYMRYIAGMGFSEIADEIGYSRIWVCKLHGEALVEFEKILN